MGLLSEGKRIAFFVYRVLEKTLTDIYLRSFDEEGQPKLIFPSIEYRLGLQLLGEKVFAITDRNAPNRRIVEIRLRDNGEHEWVDIVPERNTPIENWVIVGERMFVSYFEEMTRHVCIFDFFGKKLREIRYEATKAFA